MNSELNDEEYKEFIKDVELYVAHIIRDRFGIEPYNDMRFLLGIQFTENHPETHEILRANLAIVPHGFGYFQSDINGLLEEIQASYRVHYEINQVNQIRARERAAREAEKKQEETSDQ